MRTILVTSEITYCPQNYTPVLKAVLERSREHIAGMIILKINPISIYEKILYFYFSRCHHLKKALINNLQEVHSKTKESLFRDDHIPIPILYTKDINAAKVILWLKQVKADLIVNMRTMCIYGELVLKAPRLGSVNVHHGILPEQRGLFCDLYALADDRPSGFTIHQMTEQIDAGKILYAERMKSDKNYLRYLEELSSREGKAVAEFINQAGKNNCLPEGVANACDQPIVTTNPNFSTIKLLQQKGMIL